MSASLIFMASAWDEPPDSGDRPNPDRMQPPAVPADHPDRVLIEAIRAGDRVVFETLYLRLYDALWAFAVDFLHSGDMAEDVVQEVFLALWRQRLHWGPSGTVDTYLFAAIRNRALKEIRHQNVVARKAGFVNEPDLVDDPECTREHNDRQRRIRAAIAALPERQATALTLRWIHDMTYPDVARVLGVSAQAARTLVLRGEAGLKQALEDLRL
jgi:RNA polymerase sigma-70 factor (ECF subfamily)